MKKKQTHNILKTLLLVGVLTSCGSSGGIVTPHTHEYTFTSNHDATCTHNGTKTGTCECGDTIKVTDLGSKLNHNFTKKDPRQDYLAYHGDCEHKDVYFYACNECGAVGTETYEYGEETAHAWGAPETYGNDKVIYQCENCNEYKIDNRYKTLDVFATNDFHGSFELSENSDANRLTSFGMYFKEKSELPNTLLLDQGDTWKGGYDSNSNYGALVNEVMAYAKFDSRTVGNHDFNWGLEALKTNTISSHNGYRVPVLAGNIYNYDFNTKTYGDVQQNEIGQKYVVNVLENGLKVGVVGVIPEDQVFTINDNLIHGIGFKNYVKAAKDLCLKLRTIEKCDIVLLSVHEGVENAKKRLSSLTEIAPETGKKYCDLVLCSHTHKLEKEVVNDVLFFQNDAQLKNFRQLQMTYDALKDRVEYEETKDIVLNFDNITYSNIDRDLLDIIAKYKGSIIEKKRSVVHSNVTGDFTKEQGAYLLAKALYEEATRQNQKPDYTFVFKAYGNYDNASISFKSGELTYADFYSAYRYDSQVYTFEAKGSDIKALLASGAGRMNKAMDNGIVEIYCYKDNGAPATANIDDNATYKVCAQDDLAFHTKYLRYGGAITGYNEGSYDDSMEYTRSYDYFTSINYETANRLNRSNGDMYHYRDILENYLAKNNGPLNPSDYSRSSQFLKGNDYNA